MKKLIIVTAFAMTNGHLPAMQYDVHIEHPDDVRINIPEVVGHESNTLTPESIVQQLLSNDSPTIDRFTTAWEQLSPRDRTELLQQIDLSLIDNALHYHKNIDESYQKEDAAVAKKIGITNFVLCLCGLVPWVVGLAVPSAPAFYAGVSSTTTTMLVTTLQRYFQRQLVAEDHSDRVRDIVKQLKAQREIALSLNEHEE